MRPIACFALALVAAFLALAASVAQAHPGVCGDFDGDTKTDLAVWRAPLGVPSVWWIWKSSGGFDVRAWGERGDSPAAADYDGDTKADLAVYRSGSYWPGPPSVWWIWKSLGGFDVRTWGEFYDTGVPADYDGDTKVDLAVYRRYRPNGDAEEGTWWIWKSTGGFDVRQWGEYGDDPVPADYDGDTKADLAILRMGGVYVWWIWKSTGGFDVRTWGHTGEWMSSDDVALPQDYDGDGKADLAVWRHSTAVWWIWKSSGGFDVRAWGNGGYPPYWDGADNPVPADYDGDTKADLAVWRPSTGVWWIWKSTGGFDVRQWGESGDFPVVRCY